MRLHYPDVVPCAGSEPASAVATWGDYTLATCINYENAQGVVLNDFWVCFFITPTEFVLLNYLIVDFDFVETLPFGGQCAYGAYKRSLPPECKEDFYSRNLKCLDCCIK
jgi:hypothetical protein